MPRISCRSLPKWGKTWLGLDMAVSIASGTEALGHFTVAAKGPALVYLAEDALPQVRCRIDAICQSRGCMIKDLDLHVITAPILRLDQSVDQERLAKTIETVRPQILLLDPLVRLHRLDENSASEISGLLGYFRDLQRRYDAAIVLVHHASKKQRSQPGQALRGSSDLHAIGDCNAYLARKGDGIMLTIEHRAARSPDPMMIRLVTSGDGRASLRVCGVAAQGGGEERISIEGRVLNVLMHSEYPVPRNALRAQLRVNNQRLGDALVKLEQQGRVARCVRGWAMA